MKLGNGVPVVYVDEYGKPHHALVTQDWSYGAEFDSTKAGPSINVVYVTGDENKRDDYGQQLERATSVVFQKQQGAHGRYWKLPDESK